MHTIPTLLALSSLLIVVCPSVLFADLAGFTKWSAERSPSDVFNLLENIFGAMDKIARKRGIFKGKCKDTARTRMTFVSSSLCYRITVGVPIRIPLSNAQCKCLTSLRKSRHVIYVDRSFQLFALSCRFT